MSRGSARNERRVVYPEGHLYLLLRGAVESIRRRPRRMRRQRTRVRGVTTRGTTRRSRSRGATETKHQNTTYCRVRVVPRYAVYSPSQRVAGAPMTTPPIGNETMEQDQVVERVHALETAQATQAAAMAGAEATQAAAHAGTWSTMLAGAGGFVVGIFLGMAITNARR